MALASDDFNVSSVSPAWTPAVLNEPVFEAGLLVAAIANNCHCVVVLVTIQVNLIQFIA